jgi:hypothetical protein
MEPWAMDDDVDGIFMELDADSVAALDGDPNADAIADTDIVADHMATTDVDVDGDADADADADENVDDIDDLNNGNIIKGAINEKIKAAHAGTTRVMGWTFDHVNKLSETSTSKKGLRPMHVRVSIRVHHVSFLHPGLDDGSRSTMSDRSIFDKKLRSKPSNKVPDSGMLHFGSRKGKWTNPNNPKAIKISLGGGGGGGDGDLGGGNTTSDNAAPTKKLRSGHKSVKQDASEVAKIISAEAFRLSRDGIIQSHYALNNTSSQSSLTLRDSATRNSRSRRTQSSTILLSDSSRPPMDSSATRNKLYHAMLSPYSSANLQEAARYYRECAERPKGYRRLVVSSAMQTSDLPSPPPPSTDTSLSNKKVLSESVRYKSNKHGSDFQPRTPVADEDTNRCSMNNENLFDNVEYQYVSLIAAIIFCYYHWIEVVISDFFFLRLFVDWPSKNRSRLLPTHSSTRRGDVWSLSARGGVQRPRPLDPFRNRAQFQQVETKAELRVHSALRR